MMIVLDPILGKGAGVTKEVAQATAAWPRLCAVLVEGTLCKGDSVNCWISAR